MRICLDRKLSCEEALLQELVDAVWRAVEMQPDKITGRRLDVPASVPAEGGQSESRFSSEFPVLSYLVEALDLARSHQLSHIARRFARLVHALKWSQNPGYDETNSDPSFLAGYAYAALSGPEGPVFCAAPRGGMMLMGPNVTYADHRHAPREVYLVMTPGVEWRLDQGEWFGVAPGELIIHDAWQMHAIRTTDRPLLAFSGWIDPGRRVEIENGG